MDTLDESSRTIPTFLKKLWRMVEDTDTNEVIKWNNSGDGFVIKDQINFMTDYLPKYFKHNNMASFIRQLNLYGFHKIANVGKDHIQFTHDYFLREVPSLLTLIKRKPVTNKTKLLDINTSAHLEEILNDVKQMKKKHNLVENELKDLKQENAALWSEVNNLRAKYVKQSKIINKLIRFLVTYMQTQRSPLKHRKISNETEQKAINSGPTIFELDSNGSPAEFWKKFDETNCNNLYTVTEPTTSKDNAISYDIKEEHVRINELEDDYPEYESNMRPTTSGDNAITYKPRNERSVGMKRMWTNFDENSSNSERLTSGDNLITYDQRNEDDDENEIWRKFANLNRIPEPSTSTFSDNAIMYVPEKVNQGVNEGVLSSAVNSESMDMDFTDRFGVNEIGNLVEATAQSCDNDDGDNVPDCRTVVVNLEEKVPTTENINLLIDNTQVELESLQEILSNLNNPDFENICKIFENEDFWQPKNNEDVKPERNEMMEIANLPSDELNAADFELDSIMPEIRDLLNAE